MSSQHKFSLRPGALVIGAAAFVAVAAGVAAAAPVRSSAPPAPRQFHLLVQSNRDGDTDVYGAGAAGLRVAALTRNSVPDDNLVTSPRSAWFAVSRNYQAVLVSPDSRHDRLLRGMEAVEFSPNGRQLVLVDADYESHVYLLDVPAGRLRSLGLGYPRHFSPDSRKLAVDTGDGWAIITLATLKRTVLHAGYIHEACCRDFQWSRDSGSIARSREVTDANGDERTVVSVVGVGGPSARPKDILTGAGETVDFEWLPGGRLGYRRQLGNMYELGTIDPRTRATKIIERRSYIGTPVWSQDGRRVAYQREDSALAVATADGTSKRTVMRKAYAVEWSPDGRRLAFESWASGHDTPLVLKRNGSIRAVAKEGVPLGWSPDGSRLVLEVGTTVAITGPGLHGVRRLPLDGGLEPTIAWISGPLPETAPRVQPLPPAETATRRELRSSGRILEIASDGPWATAIVAPSRIDSDRVVAWNEESGRIVRFAKRQRPEDDDPVHPYLNLALTAFRVAWMYYACDKDDYCYLTGWSADVRRPLREHVESKEAGEIDRPPRPLPPTETRDGVTITVSQGTITLTRSSDGRTATIRPPGGEVDAELETTGLYYAYNTGGAYPGRLDFLPFGELFSAAANLGQGPR